jgi:DNA-directed RNA polymerase specialized sigma24 family protein
MSPPEWKYDATPGVEQFCTTLWNVVLLEGDAASPRAAEALERLCRTYCYPLYAYLRRLSYGPQDAQNLTEGFFARLLGNNVGATADRRKGKFRPFLLASLNHFLAYEKDRAHEAKHTGSQVPISLEAPDAENRYLQEPLPDLSPERIFERQWALAVLERALARLREEYASAGNTRHFAVLKKFLTSEAGDKAYGRVAEELTVSAGSIAVTVHRMRQRYRELVRGEIADTVAGTGDIDDETRWLVAALS